MIHWRAIQKDNFRDWRALIDFLEIDGSELLQTPSFPLNMPRRLAEKVEKGNPHDPLLRQFLPLKEEERDVPGFMEDPVSDISFQNTPRLLKKYAGRALLICTSACVMNCRFCFRQNYPYEAEKELADEIEAIRNDPSLVEVILSGGDPLSLSDERLGNLIEKLSAIPHLKLLRFHTRFPIGIPERITDAFVAMIQKSRLQTIFVLHTNHPKELDEDLFIALKKIGVPLLSQTVLTKGVNDSVETLKELFLTLSCNGVIPYYLHQLDRVKQASHFEVPIERGQALIQELRKCLPGYAVPTYVQEIVGENSKTVLPHTHDLIDSKPLLGCNP